MTAARSYSRPLERKSSADAPSGSSWIRFTALAWAGSLNDRTSSTATAWRRCSRNSRSCTIAKTPPPMIAMAPPISEIFAIVATAVTARTLAAIPAAERAVECIVPVRAPDQRTLARGARKRGLHVDPARAVARDGEHRALTRRERALAIAVEREHA